MVVDALLSLLVRTQEYNFVVRSGVFEFPVAGRITAGYRRTFISDLGSRFRFERNAPTGTPPSEGAMCQAAQDYHVEKQSRGRPAGCKKTTKAEDKTLMDTFKKLRPPGHGLTSRTLHKALPKKLSMKITPRTCRRRLAEKGYKPEQKMSETDPGAQARPTYQKHPTHTPPLYNSWAAPVAMMICKCCSQPTASTIACAPGVALEFWVGPVYTALCPNPEGLKRRMKFARAHESLTCAAWKAKLQGVGDIKEFTYYPKELHAKFSKLRAPWTYMTKTEKKLPAFQRPKRWFPKKEYQKVPKGDSIYPHLAVMRVSALKIGRLPV